MSEQNYFVASDETAEQNYKPNRKEPRQISSRVSESEYLKLKQLAEALNTSVPVFAKKKVQGSQLIIPKSDKETRQPIARNLSRLGVDANQITKYCHQHQYNAPDYSVLERNINELHERPGNIRRQPD